eukprot:COSAG06_NODE_8552_length_2131_cov_1.619094_1_plen_561_part_00
MIDTFRDDIQVDPLRLDFWPVEPFDHWSMVNEGGFGKVFGVPVAPDIEVGGRHFSFIALKVPKAVGVAELKGEVESLSGLSHENVVQILGMAFGKTKGSDAENWMMLLEFAPADLEHMLHGNDTALREQYKPKLMVKLMREIIAGLCYCHRAGRCHLDLKPENVLLAQDEKTSAWTAKLADFGAVVSEDDKDTAQPTQDVRQQSAVTEQWLGTYLWMPPECTNLNAENAYPKGIVCDSPAKAKQDSNSVFGASDWFSFGIMVWEMLKQKLPHEGLGEAFSEELIEQVWVNESGSEDHSLNPNDYTAASRSTMKLHPSSNITGQWAQDFRAVAKAYYRGNRPEITDDCPALLSKLMVACWQDRQQDRPTSTFMQRLADTRQLPDERWLEPPAQALTYDRFLEQLDLADRQEDLAEYLSEPGAELTELAQMDERDLSDDILDDGDLGFDEETKARFRAAVAELKRSGRGGEAKGKDGDACAALQVAAGLLHADAQTVDSMRAVVAEKDETIAEKDETIAEKDETIAENKRQFAQQERRLAEKNEELKQLRAQLERLEGVPPP